MSSETITVTIDGERYDGKLARIKRTQLGYEGHGIPTAWLHCEGDAWGQGAGGWNLRGEAMSAFVMGVIDALGVNDWEQVAGQQVLLLYGEGSTYPVEGIRRVVGGKPFMFRQVMTEIGERAAAAS